MAFPSGPSNGQVTTIGGITYTYNSTKTAWVRTPSVGANLSVFSTVITGTTPSTSTTSGALQVTGGIGTQGNLNVGGRFSVAGAVSSSINITDTTLSSSHTTGALVVAGGIGANGNIHIPSAYQFHIGSDIVSGSFPNTLLQINSNVNSYQQLSLQNINSGGSASSDIVATADNGSDTVNYIDMGINSSTYNDAAFTISGPNDGYLYTNGGNLVIGTQTSGSNDLIKFHTGGTLAANVRALIRDTGMDVFGNLSVGSDISLGHFDFNTESGSLMLTGSNVEFVIQGITSEPTSPSTGNLVVYSKNIGGRMLLKIKGPSGLDTPLQPMLAMNKISWWSPPGNSTTVPAVVGFNAFTAQGTVTARNVATTNIVTYTKRLGYVSAGTSGSLCGHYDTVAQHTVGAGDGVLGGFYYVCRFASSDAVAQTAARMFVGVSSSVSAATNVEPTTLTNCIGVAVNQADTNLRIVWGGSAAQTSIDLSSNFPGKTASVDLYELSLYSSSSSNNSVGYRVLRVATGQTAQGTLTGVAGTALPASTTLLAHRAWKSTNAAAAVGLDIISVYMETDQ